MHKRGQNILPSYIFYNQQHIFNQQNQFYCVLALNLDKLEKPRRASKKKKKPIKYNVIINCYKL